MSPPHYRIVVDGELGPRYASAFDEMTVGAHDGETDITGPIVDQGHLHGLIERIASLGLTLQASPRLTPRTRRPTRSRTPNQPGSTTTTPAPIRRAVKDMTLLWILLGIVYIACWIYFGLATFRKGHDWLFWIGFFVPFLWIIGTLIAPTEHAAARAAGTA